MQNKIYGRILIELMCNSLGRVYAINKIFGFLSKRLYTVRIKSHLMPIRKLILSRERERRKKEERERKREGGRRGEREFLSMYPAFTVQ